jgi:hypothetical protein
VVDGQTGEVISLGTDDSDLERVDAEPEPEEDPLFDEPEAEEGQPPPPDFLVVEVPSGTQQGKTIGQLLDSNRPYLERIAKEAHDASLRESAQAALEWANEQQPPLM